MNINETTIANLRNLLSNLKEDTQLQSFSITRGGYDQDGDFVESSTGATLLVDVTSFGPADAEQCRELIRKALSSTFGKDYGRNAEFSQDGAWMVWTITLN